MEVVTDPMTRVVTKDGEPRAPKRRAGAARANGTEPKGASPTGERRLGQGGRRLAAAFDRVSNLPVLVESQRRLLQSCEGAASNGDVADAIESDAALAIAVMRTANNGNGPQGRAGGVVDAVAALSTSGIRDIAAAIETYDPFDSPNQGADDLERFRRHAVATRHAADRIAALGHVGRRDELAVAALLHDVGRFVLAELYGDFEALDDHTATPDDRVRRERRELGIDHALVGAVLVRRWALSPGVAAAIEGHHSAKATGHAAVIRLADLIVHYASGDPAPPDAIVEAASQLGLDRERLIPLLYEFPHSGATKRQSSDPCPLSVREIDALRGLAEGKVYKQIARELSLSVSTVRTHLHNAYRKIGAVDRAQAVLIARDKGWI
jgi:putative nucleotidyltransferase with HDIG domain